MRLAGRVWRNGKFWLAEVPMLDALTQGRSRPHAFRMMIDLVETMADKKGFHVAIFPGARGAFEIGSDDAAALVAVMLRRQREKSRPVPPRWRAAWARAPRPVSDFVASEVFYDAVMRALGFYKGDRPIGGERHAHYFNRVLQLSIRPARTASAHDPYAPGLHHLCLQVATPADVDAAFASVHGLGIAATPPRRYPEYSADYYATFFADPDGIRLEIVARRQMREDIVREWGQLRSFVNPLQELHRERGSSTRGGAALDRR